jgi:hypothetical protein
MSSVPLDRIDDDVLIQLGQALWSWQYCNACSFKGKCASPSCATASGARLNRYFQFYKAIVQTYVEGTTAKQRSLQTHGDVFDAIGELKRNPDMTRASFQEKFVHEGRPSSLTDEALQDATALVVKVLVMTDCSALHHSSDRLEKGDYRVHWREEEAFSKYLQDLFPTTNHPILSHGDNDLLVDMKWDLRATKLQKRLGIRFRPTHDIRNHLRFDRRRNEVELFHYTTFIKEQLRATKMEDGVTTLSDALRL